MRYVIARDGVEPGDLATLRRRMPFEGGRRADEVGIEADRCRQG